MGYKQIIYIYSIVLLFWGATPLYAQTKNLIYNGSFETMLSCPDNFGIHARDQRVAGWTTPTLGTPDYFHSCSEKSGTPLNWVGYAEPYDGVAYMGIITCMQQIDANQIAYREYITCKLATPLDSGQQYYASMQVRLGESCNTACNGLGMFFSSQAIRSTQVHQLPLQADILLQDDPILNDKQHWQQICGTFVAKGGEQHVIIGNFRNNQELNYIDLDENLLTTQHTSRLAYYYIDKVELYAITDSTPFDCENVLAKNDEPEAFQGDLPAYATLVLNNLYFAVDEAVILPESYAELDALAAALRYYKKVRIAIQGHTDNTGTESHNRTLSQARAEAVQRYLLEKGVSRFLLESKGFGASQPLESNETEAGRQKNRRVEIKVLN